jgi:hypothetical protein
MEHGHYQSNGIADGIPVCRPTAKAEHRGTIRICDVPEEIPLGEALRKADRIAFCHTGDAPSLRPTTVAWDFIQGASTPER